MNIKLSPDQAADLIQILKQRFETHVNRHSGLKWEQVQAKLDAQPEKLAIIFQMEESGGEPDVVSIEPSTSEYTFVDCAAESPKGRRSLCYDRTAWESRKEHKPSDNAMDVAAEMGVSILDETQYRALQNFGHFDSKTSSWLATPENIRKLGGAIFGDFRYGKTFVYHNGAESYYAARGFRGMIKV